MLGCINKIYIVLKKVIILYSMWNIVFSFGVYIFRGWLLNWNVYRGMKMVRRFENNIISKMVIEWVCLYLIKDWEEKVERYMIVIFKYGMKISLVKR